VVTSGKAPALSQHTACMWGEKMVAFGGLAPGAVPDDVIPSNDIWIFSLVTGQWVQLAAGKQGPSPRYGHVTVATGGA
jgi:hypothetical protein